jgi:hypothetical protein
MSKFKIKNNDEFESSDSDIDFAKTHPLERPMATMGIGANATGKKLKKIEAKIRAYLDD